MKPQILKKTVLRSGQARAYQDSVYSYEIIVTDGATDEEVWDLCQRELKKANHRKDGHQHSGACGFPFGLESFGSLRFVGACKYIYTVTMPYCD